MKKVIVFYSQMWLFCCINCIEVKKKKTPKWETLSKQGKTKRNTKAVLLTASSTFSMCWIDSYCILQCPHTVWVMWITFTGVSDVNFNSSVITWKSKHVYPLDTILTFSGATGEVTSFKRLCSPTMPLTCSASKGYQSSKCCFAWLSFHGIQIHWSTASKDCLFMTGFRGTCCILESNT